MTAKKSKAGSRDHSRLPKPQRKLRLHAPGPEPGSMAGEDVISIKSPWPPPPAPGPSVVPTGEAGSLDYIWSPAGPPAGIGRIIIQATIPRAGLEQRVRFELDWDRLDASQRTQAWGLLARHGEGADDHLERVLAVSLLCDFSLQQNQPTMTPAQRQVEVGEALTIPERPPSDPSQDDPGEPTVTAGISPLLLWIKPQRRQWLRKRYHIDIEELKHESIHLFLGLEQFEVRPPAPDFNAKATVYTEKLIVHHQRVSRVGRLLGGRLGRALVIQAKLCIESLRSQLFLHP